MNADIAIVDMDQHPLRLGALEVGRFYRISNCPENKNFNDALVCLVEAGLMSMWYQVDGGRMYSIGKSELFENCTFVRSKAFALKFEF
jgi:hypothetical protein